jgi:hypothetical protein
LLVAASLAKGLKSRPEPRLARAAVGMILAVKVREHDFMREERRPFKGVGAVGVGAPDQFVVAVGLSNQFGVAELSNNLAAVALRDDVFQFHTPPLYLRGLDKCCPCEKSAPGAWKPNMGNCLRFRLCAQPAKAWLALLREHLLKQLFRAYQFSFYNHVIHHRCSKVNSMQSPGSSCSAPAAAARRFSALLRVAQYVLHICIELIDI